MSASQSTSTIRNAPEVNLMHELRTFIRLVSSKHKSPSIEVTKLALFLLRHLPASRFACLQYMKTVFDTAALNHIVRLEKEINTGKLPPVNEYDETMLQDIHALLCTFISQTTEAWAPVLSTFSLELLGEISSNYARRAQLNGLNDSLQFWTNCRATKTLVDITTQCLNCLMCSNTEACINALLDTSIVHSPHFDWVVAHVGSCFPETVIERVLYCGLKDYCENKTYRHGADSPKIKSVVGILGYLAISHSPTVQTALFDLFSLCLNYASSTDDYKETHRNATIPYLIQLLILSDGLVDVISSKLKEHVTTQRISSLLLECDTINWFKYFGSAEAVMDLLVGLIMKCSTSGIQILELLLSCNAIKSHASIGNWSLDLLENVLDEVGYEVRFINQNRAKRSHFLDSLHDDIDLIHKLLLSDNAVSAQTAARIVIYVGASKLHAFIQSLIFLLQNANSQRHLAIFIKIYTVDLIDHTHNHFATILQQIFDKDVHCEQLWSNIRTLLKWEKSNNVFKLNSKWVSGGIVANLMTFTRIFTNKLNKLNANCLHILGEILDILDISTANAGVRLPLEVLLNFVHGAINYFFLCCEEKDEMLRACGFKRVHRMFGKLARHSKIARNLCLRQLLEKTLFAKEALLFGALPNNNLLQMPAAEATQTPSLIEENLIISKTIHLTKHSSVYNGGVIGSGKRKSVDGEAVTSNVITHNTAQLIIAFRSCCVLPCNALDVGVEVKSRAADAQLEGLTIISLMLVELISPDVMYNGLPWPEEDFSKVTIERDMHIRRLFNTTPLLWELLNVVATHRPALCYCSVLLRALTATLIHQWNSTGDHSRAPASNNYKNLMNVTVRLVDVMTLGQLLPSPLCHVRDVIPFLNSLEIVSILRECIWCYMRDYVPSPELFCVDANGLHWREGKDIRPLDAYTKTLRTIMQRNIKTVGHLYSRMFLQ